LGISALFGILDIGALRIGDLDYGGTVTRNVLGVFNAWGMSFLPTSGTLQMVAVVHICTFDVIMQQCYTCMELNASIFMSFYWFRSTRRHGFWNQVVKAAFWILNQLFLERFADHQQDPNLLMLL
jgi:hypothetical protein